MLLSDLQKKYPILEKAIERVKEVDGIAEFYPPQVDAINSGYLDGKNLLLTIPTSSGKTLIAELGALKTVLEGKLNGTAKKVLYLVPLKALAMEKYREFNEKYSSIGIKVAVSIGDFDNNDSYLDDYDIVISSVEKADSLLRHNSLFFQKLGLIIADEIHLLNDSERGPTLEIVLTRLLAKLENVQIIALSATVNNNKEVAEWLKAVLISSDFRPTSLYEGIYFNGEIDFKTENGKPVNGIDKAKISKTNEPSTQIVLHYSKENKQSIVFVSSRKNAEAESEKLADALNIENVKLEALSKKIISTLPTPTKQCRKLAAVVKKGAAFHHAGLHHKQKELIEDAYRKGTIKALASTTTLAFGLNLPCDVVIMKEMRRFYQGRGMRYIPVLEYKQCCGRSGRAKYAKEGRAIIIAKTEEESENLKEEYVYGKSESIYSKLALEPVLRSQILSLIATTGIKTEKQLMDFMKKTFYAHQYEDLSDLESKVKRVVRLLWKYGLIETEIKGDLSSSSLFQSANSYVEETMLKPTELGMRVSELYIDPDTANLFINGIKTTDVKNANYFSFLHLVSSSLEMRPVLSVRAGDFEKLSGILEAAEPRLIVPDDMKSDEDFLLSGIKTASMFDAWISERTEDFLMENYNIAPGELRIKLANADWLLYSMQELCILTGNTSIHKPLDILRTRIKHGIKEELLNLVALKGIGRARARKLFGLGVKSITDITKISYPKLKEAFGSKIAEKLKIKVGQQQEIQQFENKQQSLQSFN